MINDQRLDSVSRRRFIHTGTVAVCSVGMIARTAASGEGATTETRDVLSQMPGEVVCPDFFAEEGGQRIVVSDDGATVHRTDNGISCRIAMPTPQPGEYIYPCPSSTATDEEGPPEAFTLWVFVFDDPTDDDWTGAFLGGGHLTGGAGTLTLRGHVSTNTEPLVGEPLSNPDEARVHLAVAPHGALDPSLMPEQIKTPSGPGPFVWWVALFD